MQDVDKVIKLLNFAERKDYFIYVMGWSNPGLGACMLVDLRKPMASQGIPTKMVCASYRD